MGMGFTVIKPGKTLHISTNLRIIDKQYNNYLRRVKMMELIIFNTLIFYTVPFDKYKNLMIYNVLWR
jgi:hypothetical protein